MLMMLVLSYLVKHYLFGCVLVKYHIFQKNQVRFEEKSTFFVIFVDFELDFPDFGGILRGKDQQKKHGFGGKT